MFGVKSPNGPEAARKASAKASISRSGSTGWCCRKARRGRRTTRGDEPSPPFAAQGDGRGRRAAGEEDLPPRRLLLRLRRGRPSAGREARERGDRALAEGGGRGAG